MKSMNRGILKVVTSSFWCSIIIAAHIIYLISGKNFLGVAQRNVIVFIAELISLPSIMAFIHFIGFKRRLK